MNNKIITAVLLCCSLISSNSISQIKESEFSKHGTVEANRSGLFHKRVTKILFKGKNGWKINTKYSISVQLDDITLNKSNAEFKEVKDDKAEEVVFATKSTSLYGTAKVVFCNESSCTNPLKVNFQILE